MSCYSIKDYDIRTVELLVFVVVRLFDPSKAIRNKFVGSCTGLLLI